MSDFQNQFDQLVAAANSAVADYGEDLNDVLADLRPANVRRLIANISKLLGQVDRREAKNPEYLAGTPRSVPERAIELIASVPTSFNSGADHFVQNVLSALVEVERHLFEAVGSAAFSAQQIKNQQIRAIDRLRQNAESSADAAREAMTEAAKSRAIVDQAAQEIQTALQAASTDSQKVAEVRRIADRLSRGNASQNPLEKLVRGAQDRFAEIETIKIKAGQAESSAAKNAEIAAKHELEAANALTSLQDSDRKADGILRNATQAGLAGAYKTERDRLSTEQNRYAFVFYGTIAGIVVYAALFLLPIFRDLLGINGGEKVTAQESALMLFVRLVILSPVVWALVFTNRRFKYLETLQMDYAAKTNTALAYSGYIDEMDADPGLRKRLKDGLVLRFLEHPSRLLGKKEEIDISSSGPDGVRVESRSATTGAELQNAEGGDDE